MEVSQMDITKFLLRAALCLSIALGLSACNQSETKETAYQKRNQTLALETEPASFRKYALVSSGDINVQNNFATDGPLADVHTNGAINARSLSLDISGRVTAANNPSGSIIRSFNYDSPLDEKEGKFVQIRALKVSEYLNTNNLDEYYLLTVDGKALYKQQGAKDTEIANSDIEFSYENNTWTLTTNQATLNTPLVVETSLSIQAANLFIAGTLMVKGDLDARGELNINTGTPFEKALIVDRNISVEKLVTIGRLHGSGSFTSYGEVNILGNAEIDGDVNLYGDAKINFLDNIFKAALYEAQEQAGEEAISMTLIHSQLFSDVKGKNSVVLFTFVEGDYILNENVVNSLIENNQIDEFKFKSYLYGASIDYGAQLQKFDGLSPYFANKQAILKKLADEGYTGIKISESLDIAPSNLYHSFKDQQGNLLGTYQVYSLANSFNQENPMMLTQEGREGAIYEMDNKAEIEQQREQEAQEQQAIAKKEIIDSEDYDEETKEQLLTEINDSMEAEESVDKVALEKEATQDRVNEWVEYKDLATENKEVEVAEIAIEGQGQTRGWFKRLKRKIKKAFKKVTFRDCRKKYEKRRIKGVWSAYSKYKKDPWYKDITIYNAYWGYCTPTSIAMIINYHHHIIKKKGSLYDLDTERYSRTNKLSHELASKFGTKKPPKGGTFNLIYKVPKETKKAIYSKGMRGHSFTWYSSPWNRAWHHRYISHYIRKNQPVMLSTHRVRVSGWGKIKDHSMPVIGYKRQKYSGSCWKKALPDRRWILVDTTYRTRGYIRFDSRSNYMRYGMVTYVKVY
jgi:cytoskeletal protein CcmA (bactofilin family)